MSEIEKMMQNAEVKQERMCEWTCKGSEHCSTNCEHYESTLLYYPPFTAEKQLELIKWLIVHSPDTCLEDEIIVCAFEDSLANIINNLWQDLTEEEKQQIKEILE